MLVNFSQSLLGMLLHALKYSAVSATNWSVKMSGMSISNFYLFIILYLSKYLIPVGFLIDIFRVPGT